MTKLLIKTLFSFVTIENVSYIIAKCIAYILRWASKKGGKNWDKAKAIIKNVEKWSHIFNEVYDDDNLSANEEEQIASALENSTTINSISELLKK